jgi:hypothetical protein
VKPRVLAYDFGSGVYFANTGSKPVVCHFPRFPSVFISFSQYLVILRDICGYSGESREMANPRFASTLFPFYRVPLRGFSPRRPGPARSSALRRASHLSGGRRWIADIVLLSICLCVFPSLDPRLFGPLAAGPSGLGLACARLAH